MLGLALAIRAERAIEECVLVAYTEGGIESTRCHFLIIFINIINVKTIIIVILLPYNEQSSKDNEVRLPCR